MKKQLMGFLAVVFAMGLGWAGVSFAADASRLPIAIVDGNQVFQKFQPAIEEELKKDFKDQQQKLVKMQEELQAMGERLDRDAEIMSETELEKMQAQFAEKQMEFQALSVEYNEAYNEKGNAAFQALIEKVQTAAAALAKEKGFAVVMQRGAVLYADDTYDVTADLVQRVENTK